MIPVVSWVLEMPHELLEHSNSGNWGIRMLRKHDCSDSTKTRRQILERITKIPSSISATAGFGFETLILCCNPLGLIPRCPTPPSPLTRNIQEKGKGNLSLELAAVTGVRVNLSNPAKRGQREGFISCLNQALLSVYSEEMFRSAMFW